MPTALRIAADIGAAMGVAGTEVAMGVGPIADDVMARKPRPRSQRIIDGRMGLGVAESGEVARTAAFTVLVLTQLFNCFTACSASASAVRAAFSNHWLWAAVVLSATLQVAVVHLPFLNLAFGTVPFTVAQWGVCVVMASAVLWSREGRKLLQRR